MPYRKTGFFAVPRALYIPRYAAIIEAAFSKDKLDRSVSEAIRSLGRENIYLRTFYWERLLAITHPTLDADPELKKMFVVLLGDFLVMTGYLKTVPTPYDYTEDPVYNANDLIDLVVGTRMPKWTSADLGGESATIDALMTMFAEVIRRNAIILQERKTIALQFRQWISSIGHKLLVHQGELTQTERSFFTVYCATGQYSKGNISGITTKKLAAVECLDPLVLEVASICTSLCLSGPSTNHYKMISNANLEQLVFYYGPHTPKLQSYIGYEVNYGPFKTMEVKPADALEWSLEAQIFGILATVQNFQVKVGEQPPFTLSLPLADMQSDDSGKIAAYPDDPSFRLWLEDQTDCASYTWDYPSTWRRRRINSRLDGGSMDYAIADAAVMKKTAGAVNTDLLDLANAGLCWLEPAADAFVIRGISQVMVEQIILPGINGPEFQPVPCTAYYARFGNIYLKPAYCSRVVLPADWFMQPDDNFVAYVTSTIGLTMEHQSRYRRAITISHNCAVYTRMTGETPPVDPMQIAKALMGM